MANKNVGAGISEDRARELITEAILGLATEKNAVLLIGAATEGIGKELALKLAGLVTEERVIELLQGAVTEDQVRQMIGDEFFPQGRLVLLGDDNEEGAFDPAWLAGLGFKGAKKGGKAEPGQRRRNIPFIRPLTPEDVLSFRETETTVRIVAADGQCHTVQKKN